MIIVLTTAEAAGWLRFANSIKETVMAGLQDVNNALTALSASVETERQQVADAIAAVQAEVASLNALVADLRAQIEAGDGVTPGDLDAIVANITAIDAAVQSIQA